MRTVYLIFSFLTVLLLLLPLLLCRPGAVMTKTEPVPSGAAVSAVPQAVCTGLAEDAVPGFDEVHEVIFLRDGKELRMPLSALLTGILLAEMPTGFDAEAHRAQVVAARTYLLYRERHGLPLSGDAGTCCAYFDEAAGRAFYGDLWETALARAEDAVAATDGEVLLWEGEPACTVFHAMSWKHTAAAETVWGSPVPYLIAVSTPEPADLAGMRREYVFTREMLSAATGIADPLPAEEVIGADGETEALILGGTVMAAGELRTACGLRSARISVAWQDTEQLRLVSMGYGHGVGMSQHGAQELALSGAGYEEILLHYYPGASLAILPSLWYNEA